MQIWRDTQLGLFLHTVVQLDAQKSLWPQTIVATKTKRPLWSRVVLAAAVVAILYQNAAVLYLNIDVAIFFCQFGNQKIVVILVQQAKNLPSTKEGVFCTFVDFLVAPNHDDFLRNKTRAAPC